eukprot:gene3698-14971_t
MSHNIYVLHPHHALVSNVDDLLSFITNNRPFSAFGIRKVGVNDDDVEDNDDVEHDDAVDDCDTANDFNTVKEDDDAADVCDNLNDKELDPPMYFASSFFIVATRSTSWLPSTLSLSSPAYW